MEEILQAINNEIYKISKVLNYGFHHPGGDVDMSDEMKRYNEAYLSKLRHWRHDIEENICYKPER